MAVSLLLMTAGWLGIWLAWPSRYGRWASIVALIGSIMMIIGIAAEFWLYSDLPYAGSNMRHAAFTAFGIGGLLMDIGVMGVGVSAWRSRFWPRWSAIILMLALPIDFAAFFWLDSLFLTAAILALVIGYNLVATELPPD